MKYAEFPHLGRRPYTEFAQAGVLEPEPDELAPEAVAPWVYARRSVPRERVEWWYHLPTRLWFRVRRDTASDTVLGVEAARGDER
ncbi:MAG: sarcosine oxidase subunit delta [Gammaproteobacteria bacterium]|nr:sarcosine oxidase subunit delta [Gammaproteobacteria bacterium]